jgi:peptidoglycan endopeptidase LytE
MTTKILVSSVAVLGLVSCQSLKKNEYDTNDPYGVPDYGAETANYQSVNPPANSTYAPAAYQESALPPEPPASVAPAAPAGPTRSHTVAKGDSLWKLSRKYGVPVSAIKAANGMTNDTIQLGKTIKIPAQ